MSRYVPKELTVLLVKQECKCLLLSLGLEEHQDISHSNCFFILLLKSASLLIGMLKWILGSRYYTRKLSWWLPSHSKIKNSTRNILGWVRNLVLVWGDCLLTRLEKLVLSYHFSEIWSWGRSNRLIKLIRSISAVFWCVSNLPWWESHFFIESYTEKIHSTIYRWAKTRIHLWLCSSQKLGILLVVFLAIM
jgi:hypothetical protein